MVGIACELQSQSESAESQYRVGWASASATGTQYHGVQHLTWPLKTQENSQKQRCSFSEWDWLPCAHKAPRLASPPPRDVREAEVGVVRLTQIGLAKQPKGCMSKPPL